MRSRSNLFIDGLIALMLLLLPLTAHAQTAGAVQIVDFLLLPFLQLIQSGPVLLTLGTIIIVVAALRVMTSNDESGIEKAKKALGAIAVGVVLMLLSGAIAGILYNPDNFFSVLSNADKFNGEIVGFTDWLSGIAAALGLLMIIISALRAVISMGDEDAYKKVRTSVLYAVIGLFIIAIDKVMFINAVLSGTPNPILAFIIRQLQFLLGFVTFIALLVIIYAGVRLVANFGDEDAYNQAKGILIRTTLGLVVITFSYVLAQFVLSLF